MERSTHQQISQGSLVDLIGLPYCSFDCWDLVRLFYHKVLSVDLGINTERYDPFDRDETSALILNHTHKFLKVSKPEFGDIILLNIYGQPAHLGVYIDKTRLLHTMEKTGSIIDKYSMWDKRIVGFYRYDQNKN